jgi:DNA-directed RNA polymerase specialized sigma24 family protein
LTDEVFDRITRRIDEGQVIFNIKAYVYSVATFVFKEWLKQKEHNCQLDETLVIKVDAKPEDEDDDFRIRCFDKCLARFTDEEREILIEYHTGEKREKIERRTQLAGRLNTSLNALRIRVHRIRKELENCVKTCVAQKEFDR